MKDQALLAILQQSEYNWCYFRDWYRAHYPQLPSVKPPEMTFKLKLIVIFNYLLFFLPVLTRLRLALCLTTLIESPYKWWLIKMAKRKLSRLKGGGLTVVAIAGSYGKTSTKIIAAQLLKQQKKVVMTEKSFNTPLGISQTIRQKLTDSTQLFLVEFGEYYQGDIKRLCHFIQPELGIMTPLGAQHLERMGRLKDIAQTISELANYLIKEKKSVLIHQSYYKYLAEALLNTELIQSYGESTDNNYRLIDSQVSRAGTEYQIDINQEELTGFTPLLGKHQVVNILPSFWLAHKLGLKLTALNQATARLEYLERRHQPQQLNNNVLLLDNSYNTNPQSIQSSLKLIESLPASQKIVITMGFIELGEASDHWHYQLGQQLANVANYVGLISSRWNQAVVKGFLDAGGHKTNFITAANPTEALDKLHDKIVKNSLILLEGGYQEIYT